MDWILKGRNKMKINLSSSLNHRQQGFNAKIISNYKPCWGEFVLPASWNKASAVVGDVNGVVKHDRFEILKNSGGKAVEVFSYYAPGELRPTAVSRVQSPSGTYRIPEEASLGALSNLEKSVKEFS